MRRTCALFVALGWLGCAHGAAAPEPSRVALARGLVEHRLYRVARGQLEAEHREHGASAESRQLLGIAQRELGDLDAALASFDAVLASEPRNAAAHHGRARTLDRLGRSEEAWDAYRRAIELDPVRAAVHNDLGFSLLAGSRTEESLEALRSALELEPGLAAARTNLALAYALLGRDEEALDALRSRRAPAALQNDLGVLHELRGEREAAVAAYRAALSISPGYGPALSNLARLGEDDAALGAAQRQATSMQVLDPAAPHAVEPAPLPGDLVHEIYRERYRKELVEEPERERSVSQEVRELR